MAGINTQSYDDSVDTDIFVVIESENDCYGFVTIDENAFFDAVVIDMSQDEFANAIIVTFEEDTSSDSFVSIDEDQDQVIISDFKTDD